MSRTATILLMILLIPLLISCHRMTSEEIANRDRAQTRMAERTERSAEQHESALKASQKEYWSEDSIRKRQDVFDAKELARAEAEGVRLKKLAIQIEKDRIADKERTRILESKARLDEEQRIEEAEIATAAVQAASEPKLRRLTFLLEQLGSDRDRHKYFSGNLTFFFCFGNDYSLVDPVALKIDNNWEGIYKHMELKMSDDQMKSVEIAFQGSIFVPDWYGDAQGSIELESSLTTSVGDNPCDKKLELKEGSLVFNYIRNKNIGKIRMTWKFISLQ